MPQPKKGSRRALPRSTRSVAADALVPSGPYRIQAAADLCGVAAATLRAWERRYGIPVPRRTASAYRLYTAEDVELVRRMRSLVDRGISPAEAAREVLASASDRSTPAAASPTSPTAPDGVELARARLLSAALRFDTVTIDTELARLSMLLDAISMYERVISPLLVEVGLRWEAGTFSIAQEHLLSERLEHTMRASLRALERGDGPLVLAGCIDREQHVLGLLGACLKLAASGARVVLLGAISPPAAIASAVAAMQPRLVALSVCMPVEGPRALMRAYGAACADTPWVVGGPGASALQALIQDAGGHVALGGSAEWHVHVREWLRPKDRTRPSQPSGRPGGARR